MAETVAFRTFLTRIGLTDATRTAIENQGITNLAELASAGLPTKPVENVLTCRTEKDQATSLQEENK